MIVTIVLLGWLETSSIIVTCCIVAGGAVKVSVYKQERAQAGVGLQACLIGIKVLGRAKVEGFLPPDGGGKGSWVTVRGGIVGPVQFPA